MTLTRQGCVTIDEASDPGAFAEALAWQALFNRSEPPLGSLGRDDGKTPLPSQMVSLLHSGGVS